MIIEWIKEKILKIPPELTGEEIDEIFLFPNEYDYADYD